MILNGRSIDGSCTLYMIIKVEIETEVLLKTHDACLYALKSCRDTRGKEKTLSVYGKYVIKHTSTSTTRG